MYKWHLERLGHWAVHALFWHVVSCCKRRCIKTNIQPCNTSWWTSTNEQTNMTNAIFVCLSFLLLHICSTHYISKCSCCSIYSDSFSFYFSMFVNHQMHRTSMCLQHSSACESFTCAQWTVTNNKFNAEKIKIK